MDDLNKAREALDQATADHDKANTDHLGALNLDALSKLYQNAKETLPKQIQDNNERIKTLEAERENLLKAKQGNVSDIVAKQMDLPPAPEGSDATTPAPNPAPATGVPAADQDYFTSISVEVSSSYKHDESTQKSQSTSAGVSGRIGPVSFGGSMAYSKSSADAQSQMANSNVKVSFDCMRVDIDRSWLRPELFYDEDLQVAPKQLLVQNLFLLQRIKTNHRCQSISPGPLKLGSLMDPDNYKSVAPETNEHARQQQLEKYSTFPLYPTGKLFP